MFGERWGAAVLLSVRSRAGAADPWPAWESERATRVRDTCRAIVAPLAHSLPERRDSRLVEAFAVICAAAAAEAYASLSAKEAQALVEEHDRRFPGWRRDMAGERAASSTHEPIGAPTRRRS